MRKALAGILFSILVAAPVVAQTGPSIPSIFTGHDLSGWVVPQGNIWFMAQDGILKIKNGPDQTGHILWTRDSYADFVMEFEFKMGAGTVDSGVFVRKASMMYFSRKKASIESSRCTNSTKMLHTI